MRKIARIICKCPVKKDTLQSYVISENHKNIHLLLDSKTRWNSVIAMLEPFFDIRSPVEKILIDCKINKPLSEAGYTVHAALLRVLKHIRLGFEKLCSQV